MSILFRLIAAALLCAAMTSHAQTDESFDEALQSRLASIDRDVAALDELKAVLPSQTGLREQVLTYRLDARLLRILRHADELATLLSTAPNDGPLVTRLREQFANGFDEVGTAIFDRMDDLDAKITAAEKAMEDLSGSNRIETAAEVDVLDSLRERYLVSLARHLEVREKLGLNNDTLKPAVERRLRLRAEALSGALVMSSSMVQEYRRQLRTQGNRAEVDPLLARASDRRDYLLTSLRDLSGAMESIDMDTRDYRSLLISEEGISFRLFDRNVLARLTEDWIDAIKAFSTSRGPDILFGVFMFLAIIFVFQLLAKLVRRLVRAGFNRSGANFSQLLKNTAVSLSGGIVLILGILVALSQIGVSVGPMLAGLGIAGFIVGFALQDTLGNFASGAMILIYRPFDVDDYVEVTGASGLVKRMNLVSTTITTLDNQVLVVPNSKIWGDVIKNVTHQRMRRVDLEFGIGYSDDIPKAERILAEAAADHALVLESPETNVKVNSLGDSSVNLILRPWVKTEDYWTVYWDLTRDVKLRFDREGISIPFPQRDVHLYQSEQ